MSTNVFRACVAASFVLVLVASALLVFYAEL